MEPNDDPSHQTAEIKEDTPKVGPVQTAEEEDVDLEWFYDMANIFPWIRYWKYKGEEPVDSDDEEAQRKPAKKKRKAAGASDPKPSTSKSSETNGRARKRKPAPESDGSDVETPPRRSRKRAETPDWEMPTKSNKARSSNGSEGEPKSRGRPRRKKLQGEKLPIWQVDEPVSHCQDEQHDMLELFTRDHHCETCGVDLKVRASETGQGLVNHAITHIDGDHHDGEQYEFHGRLVTMRDPMFSREVKRVAAASFPAYKEDCADYVNEKRKQQIEEHEAGKENQDKPPHENDQEMRAVVKNECQTCMKKLAVQPQASLNTINLIKHSIAHLETETYFADLTATVMANFPLQADELMGRIAADKEELVSNGALEHDDNKLLLTVASNKDTRLSMKRRRRIPNVSDNNNLPLGDEADGTPQLLRITRTRAKLPELDSGTCTPTSSHEMDVPGLAAGRPRRTRVLPPRFTSATSATSSTSKTFLETMSDDQGPPEEVTGRPSRIRKPPPRLGFDDSMQMDDDDSTESDYEEVFIGKKTPPRPAQRRPKNVATTSKRRSEVVHEEPQLPAFAAYQQPVYEAPWHPYDPFRRFVTWDAPPEYRMMPHPPIYSTPLPPWYRLPGHAIPFPPPPQHAPPQIVVATPPSNQVKYRPRVPPPRPFANRRLTPPSEIDPLALLAIISEMFKADVPAGTYEAAAAGGLYKDFYPRHHRWSARFEQQPADDGDKFDAVNNNLHPFPLPNN
ncbi:unnamed protein product, partial [Mesorhabditis spiculigera]